MEQFDDMRYVVLIFPILLMALACNPASGFKPYCDCADMDGQWTTERQLFENGELTDHIDMMNMSIQMNECGAKGTLGKGGKIFNSYFAGNVANNLIGKWSLDGEEGTYNIQLQNNEHDCSYFAGNMYSGWNYSGKNWQWTGHKEAISPPDNAPPLPFGSASTPISAGKVEIEITSSQGVSTLKAGGQTTFELGKSDEAVINAICEKTLYKIGLIQLIYGDTDFANWPAIIQYNLVNYVSIFGVFCQVKTPTYTSSFDISQSNFTSGSLVDIKLELMQGPIRIEVINDQVAMDIETPTVILSSQGKNAFGVAYDPTSGMSHVDAYQYPIQVQPTDGNHASFILESGQQVEVGNGQVVASSSSGKTSGEGNDQKSNPGHISEGSEGGCYADPITGEIVCIDSSGKPSQSNGGMEAKGSQSPGTQDLCFEDPESGEIICTESGG
ncbi:MAG: hypothetical protein PHN61_00655 [Methanothrix sp.]|nr:hypothetical protein [Methanothrix sp.]